MSSAQQINQSSDLIIQKGLFALHEFTSSMEGGDIKPYLGDVVTTVLGYVR